MAKSLKREQALVADLKKSRARLTEMQSELYKISAELREALLRDSQKDLRLAEARTMIRDMAHDWPVSDLFCSPKEMCDNISRLLGEAYDFETGDIEETT